MNRVIRLLDNTIALISGICVDIARQGESEEGIINAHMKFTQPGDHVVIVGGGDGTTAVTASELVTDQGSVVVCEAGDRSVMRIAHLVASRGVAHICTIRHALVGPDIDVYGGDATAAERIAPENLPACDILELDCEGAEIEILRSLVISPRVIIVEIHPKCFSEDPEWVLGRLDELGYQIVYRSGHEGVEITDLELKKLLISSKKRRSYLRNGARSPAIVAAIQKS